VPAAIAGDLVDSGKSVDWHRQAGDGGLSMGLEFFVPFIFVTRCRAVPGSTPFPLRIFIRRPIVDELIWRFRSHRSFRHTEVQPAPDVGRNPRMERCRWHRERQHLAPGGWRLGRTALPEVIGEHEVRSEPAGGEATSDRQGRAVPKTGSRKISLCNKPRELTPTGATARIR